MKKNRALFIFTFLLLASSARSQYVVDQDLGQVASGASVRFTGDTSAAGGPVRNAAGFHFGLTRIGGNWGNERVFEFQATEPLLIELESVAITSDPDFFLLDSLETFDVPAAGKFSSSSARSGIFLDGETGSTESLRGVPPGLYYISVENFDGFDLIDGPVPKQNASFTALLKTSPATAYDLRVIREMVAATGGEVFFNTNGSGMDTVIALYRDDDGTGTLIATNDNAGDGVESELTFADGLEAGTYLVGVGGAGTVFGEDYQVTPGTTEGPILLNHSNGPLTAPTTLTGSLDLSFAATSVQYYSFVVQDPPPAIDLGELAKTGESFSLSLLNSPTLQDSEIALFDDQGFLIDTNDDANADTFLSFLEIPSLPFGTYYVAVGGWDYLFLNGFQSLILGGGTTQGDFTLDFPGGSESGFAQPGLISWYRFEVGLPVVEITSFTLDRASGEVRLTWSGDPRKSYAIHGGANLENLQLIAGQNNLTTGSTSFIIDPGSNPKQFFQVREE